MKTLYRGSEWELDVRQEKVLIYKYMHYMCNQPCYTPLGHIHLTPAARQKQENRKRAMTETLHRKGSAESIFDFKSVSLKFRTSQTYFPI